MKLPGLKARVSLGLAGFAGLPPLRSGRQSSSGLKAWGFLAGLIKVFHTDVFAFVRVGRTTRWRERTVNAWIEEQEKKRRRRNFED